ncbi:hypothetical protein ACFT5C_03855 [Streptomyces sp. NPDC057116]|uniref:hypothetical protein n=1 Tax=Streptomyces sp. NPDC057116 TaxID=3346023 RepID=UPI003636FE13
MVTAQKVRGARAAAETGPDYEMYEQAVLIFSKILSEEIVNTLELLKDPNAFSGAVNSFAANQGIDRGALFDTSDIFHAFWKLANGIKMDVRWASSSGVPARSGEIGHAVVPSKDVATERSGIGFGAFGVGIGISW